MGWPFCWGGTVDQSDDTEVIGELAIPAAVAEAFSHMTRNIEEGMVAVTKLVGIWDGLPHDFERPRVSVVIPALNEERNLPHVAARMPADIDEIVFVDGHSIDDTRGVARQLWPQAIHITQSRRGKGNALACGF